MVKLFGGSSRTPGNRTRNRRLACESLENRIVLATFFVTNGADSGAGSLRQAIADANALAGADTIEFTAVTNVTLTTAQLVVTDSVAIDGASAGAAKVTITRDAAAPTFRIFSVNDATNNIINVSMNNLRISNGDARDEADIDTRVTKRGGGVDNTENLTITNSIITGNFARRGGGISHRSENFPGGLPRGGTLTIDNTEIVGNDAVYRPGVDETGRGGALSSIFAGKVTITNSKLNNNRGGSVGGAVETSVSVELEMRDSEMNGNTMVNGRAVMYNSQFGNVQGPNTTALLERVTIENNTATGGAIFGALHVSQNATTTLRDSVIRNNTGLFGVSAFTSLTDVNLTIERSTISGNQSGGVSANYYTAAGFYASTAMDITDSSIINNGDADAMTPYGYGLLIANPANSTIMNSTISGNRTNEGGGGLNTYIGGTPTLLQPTLNIVSTTITNNTALSATGLGRGGGVFSGSAVAGAFVNTVLRNTIVSGNTDVSNTAADVYDYGFAYLGTPFISGSFSLIGDNAGSNFMEANPVPDPNGNLVGSASGGGVLNAMLGPLQNNGGPTDTHLPMAGSPAINNGDDTITGFDQRGFTRPGGAGTDIGSVEADGSAGGVNVDFNGDGNYDCADMNLLEAAIDAGMPVATFDVNGDNALTSADVFAWLMDAGELRFGAGRFFKNGDANLDGSVDGSDFGIWNANKFTPGNRWCLGDFNQDNSVDGSDFGVWNANKFTSSDAGRGNSQQSAARQEGPVNLMRRVKPQAMDDGGDVELPSIQLQAVSPTVAVEVKRVEMTFGGQSAQPRAAEPFASARKVSLTGSFTQSRMAKSEAHDEVMKIFETF